MPKGNEAFYEAWVKDAELRGLAKTSLPNYKRCVRSFLTYLGPTSAKQLNIEHLRGFLAQEKSRGVAGQTLSGTFSAIAHFTDFLEYEGELKANPTPGFRRRYLGKTRGQKAGNTRQLAEVEDLRRLVHNVADARDRALITLLAKAGLRNQELVDLDVESVDLVKQDVWVKPHPKRSNCHVFIDDETVRVLRRWLAVRKARVNTTTGPLFTGTKGGRIPGSEVNKAVKRAAAAVGLHRDGAPLKHRFNAHALRHFFSTHLRRNGMERDQIGWLRGDTGRESLDTYLHFDERAVREAYRRSIPQLGL